VAVQHSNTKHQSPRRIAQARMKAASKGEGHYESMEACMHDREVWYNGNESYEYDMRKGSGKEIKLILIQ